MPARVFSKLLSGGQHELLIAAAESAPRRIDQRDGRLAATDDAIRP